MSYNKTSVIYYIVFFHTYQYMEILILNSFPKWHCKGDAESLLITTEWNNMNEKYKRPKAYWEIQLKGKSC